MGGITVRIDPKRTDQNSFDNARGFGKAGGGYCVCRITLRVAGAAETRLLKKAQGRMPGPFEAELPRLSALTGSRYAPTAR